MSSHKHQPIIVSAAETLLRDGKIETFDAVYRWTCPCGVPQRTTRLADTVYALRHAYRWTINTSAPTGNLATYTLVKAGDMPGDESAGPHPRRLVRDQAATSAETPTQQQLPGGEIETAHPIMAAFYVCSKCGETKRDIKGEVLIGDWVKAYCATDKAITIWKPRKAAAA